MQPTQETETAIIPIDVVKEDQGPLLSGTFKQPYPLVRVKQNTEVAWRLNYADNDAGADPGARDSFIVSFVDRSPFREKVLSDRTGPMTAVHMGSFHYQVFVRDGATGVVYAIQHCPVMQVDN
jgi:hypothetical protein